MSALSLPVLKILNESWGDQGLDQTINYVIRTEMRVQISVIQSIP